MSQYFRNLSLFRLPESFCWPADFSELAQQHRAREPGPLELSASGFISPYSSDDERLTISVNGFELIREQCNTRDLPARVVDAELGKRVRELQDKEGRRVGARERKRLKEEVITTLLPRAFITSKSTSAYVDRHGGWIVVDTTSRKTAENVVSSIREVLGRFPAMPMGPTESPRALMTHWLMTGQLPEGFALGEDVELRDPAEGGAIWRGRRQDLESDEVREHIKSGKQVFQLGLVFKERLAFVLSEDLSVRKFKMLDVQGEESAVEGCETAEALALAEFTLLTLEIKALLQALEGVFGLHRTSADEDAPAAA